ncbi:MAG TPA: nucleotidyltransferase domain-containing protein [Thermoanaerobaculia bacterium]|nr:nucleotidyltransferase domain-containing protein [Thermoanaerobaculia bacterium]
MQKIIPPGTQVVATRDVPIAETGRSLPGGAVGVIVRAPADPVHAYRVRFVDGGEATLARGEFSILNEVRQSGVGESAEVDWTRFIIFRCVVGSRAYGLEHEESDVDRRGIYLPPSELQWALYGVPEQLENDATQEVYWELEKFLKLALKANPGILECLYSPLVEHASELAQELLAMREIFLSKLVYQTYNGYVLSQFKKIEQDVRTRGEVRWKHPMHLIRLLLSGIAILRDGYVPVRVEEHRDALLAIRHGAMSWDEVYAWRLALHKEFDEAFTRTTLPERPDFERANAFLIRARRTMVEDRPSHRSARRSVTVNEERAQRGALVLPELVTQTIESHRYPLVFATISGAHLYGFASPDSDYDVRGVHVLPAPEVLGLTRGEETIETMLDGPPEVDLVTHDAEKFFRLLLKRNGYVLEQVLSPLVAHTTPEHDELRDLARRSVTRHHAHHYLGFSENQWRLIDKERPRRLKPLLYVFRVLLTGIHLMRTGEVEANLPRLNEIFRLPYLPDLIARKTGGAEQQTIEDADLQFFENEYSRLRELLTLAHATTSLPEETQTRDELHALLLRLRGV